MQIKLIIAERDDRYRDMITRFLEKNHLDTLEIFSFSGPELLRNFLAGENADVILLDRSFGIEASELAAYGKVACLCDSESEETKTPVRTIAKYKKPDLIYNDILDLYAESGSRVSSRSGNKGSCNLILITSFSGGNGASTYAAACAKKSAAHNKRTLYLNLEPTGSSADFFSGTGSYSFEDLIFALKSQRVDVGLKMKSTVREDKSGVFYFEPCSSAMYMLELGQEDILRILNILSTGGDYENVVVDMDFRLDTDFMEIMNCMDKIVLVENGGTTANTKFARTADAVKILEGQTKCSVMNKMCIFYNNFSSSESSSEIQGFSIPVLGKLPPVKHAVTRKIVDYMVGQDVIFGSLLE